MSELINELRQNFTDEEFRNSYAESFMNSYVAAQIKVLREEYHLTQDQLGEKIGTPQPGIARFENVNYSSWKVETLRKLARALNVWLKISFEEFGTLPSHVDNFSKRALIRAPFERDPVFLPSPPPAMSNPPQLGKTGVEGQMGGEIADEAESFRKQPQRESLGDYFKIAKNGEEAQGGNYKHHKREVDMVI